MNLYFDNNLPYIVFFPDLCFLMAFFYFEWVSQAPTVLFILTGFFSLACFADCSVRNRTYKHCGKLAAEALCKSMAAFQPSCVVHTCRTEWPTIHDFLYPECSFFFFPLLVGQYISQHIRRPKKLLMESLCPTVVQYTCLQQGLQVRIEVYII